jgi:hypothetical protein
MNWNHQTVLRENIDLKGDLEHDSETAIEKTIEFGIVEGENQIASDNKRH